jgi:hypothetical protein
VTEEAALSELLLPLALGIKEIRVSEGGVWCRTAATRMGSGPADVRGTRLAPPVSTPNKHTDRLLLLHQADGHCLYRSLEDQLQQTAAGDDSSSSAQQQPDYQQLRELAAEHIRQHR